MREEISLIDEYDRACHGRAHAEFSDADYPEPRGWRDNWPYAVPGLVTLALLAAAGVALAQERTDDCAAVEAMPGAVVRPLSSYGGDADVLALAPMGDQGARLCYLNHGAQVSGGGTWRLSVEGLEIRVSIEVGGASETMTVVPPEGWMVWPADYATAPVADGSALTVTIFSGMM